jgi:hypothetical protein
MKNLLIIFLLFLFTNAGCTNKQDEVSKKLGDSFQLKATESVSFNDNGNTVTVKLINIQDSRCPVNVQCFRAGEAIVMIDLQIGDEQFKGLKVCIGCEKEMNITESTVIKAKTKTYTLKLNSVDPYPTSTGLVTPTATLEIN